MRNLQSRELTLYPLSDQKSGGTMDTVYFALIDKYGNVVSIDTDSKLYLSVIQNSSNKFPSTFETSTTFTV